MSSHVLLVEDDKDLLDTFTESLEDEGYAVISSTNATSGFKLYENHSPCIVFSDIQLNGIDGYELFSKIKEFDPAAKVILVTGHDNYKKTVIAKNNGLLGVIHKPVRDDALVDAIKENKC